MGSYQERLTLDYLDVAVLELDPSLPGRLDLGAQQGDARLQCFQDLVVVTRPSVGGQSSSCWSFSAHGAYQSTSFERRQRLG